MNEAQKVRLDALITELEDWPTPELIVECSRMVCSLGVEEPNFKRFSFAFSGGIAAEKLLAYLQQLRRTENLREALGRKIHGYFENAWALSESDDETTMREATSLIIEAGAMSGDQEVQYHVWAVCVGRIERFLPMAAKAAGHKIPPEDLDLLSPYRKLRDYYEHLDDKLPGGKNHSGTSASNFPSSAFSVEFGLQTDENGYFIVEGHQIDISLDGLRHVEAVLSRNWNALAPAALSQLRKHFELHPDSIPNPKSIEYRPLFHVGLRRALDLNRQHDDNDSNDGG